MTARTPYQVAFVHQPGDNVILRALKLPGVVTGVLRASDGDQYQVVWWWDGQRRCEWLHGFEIEGAT